MEEGQIRQKHIETQTEWEIRMSEKILGFVRDELYMDLRYMGQALSVLTPCPEEQIRTFATDGICLKYSTEQMLRVFKENPAYLNRLLLHVIFHCLYAHLWIGGQRERFLWHIACDIAVEYTIDKLDKPCTRRILGWIRQEVYRQLEEQPEGISAAVIYRWLLPQRERWEELQREFGADDHRYWPKEEKGQAMPQIQQQAQKRWNQTARQTQLEQKKKGEDSNQEIRLLQMQIQAGRQKRNYRDFLRKFTRLREELHSDPDTFDLSFYTYGLSLYQNMPLIEPLESREVQKIRDFVIVIDTSYSTSGPLVEHFLQETLELLLEQDSFMEHTRICLLQCDDQVRAEQILTNRQQIEQIFHDFKLSGGGGTDFRPAFARVEQLLEQGIIKKPEGLLYFTDGQGIYPKKCPSYQTAFLYLKEYDREKVPSWAMQLLLEPEKGRE